MNPKQLNDKKARNRSEKRSSISRARELFLKHGGILRTSEALREGIHPRTLYQMRSTGLIEMLTRGLYRLADLPPLEAPDFAIIARRVPQAVVCLISALTLHELTTQIPHTIQLALPRSAGYPMIEYPPIQIFRYSAATFEAGIEERESSGLKIRLYSPEKTIADCFKYRNKLGLDVAIEALRKFRERGQPALQKILDFARLARVETVIRPYLEAVE